MMVNKEQLMRGILAFIDNDMIPAAEGNYKIILRMAKAAIMLKPDSVFDLIKNNTFVSMLGVINERNCIDIDTFARMLSEGIGNDEFSMRFKLLGSDYVFAFSASDVMSVKRYIEQSQGGSYGN